MKWSSLCMVELYLKQQLLCRKPASSNPGSAHLLPIRQDIAIQGPPAGGPWMASMKTVHDHSHGLPVMAAE